MFRFVVLPWLDLGLTVSMHILNIKLFPLQFLSFGRRSVYAGRYIMKTPFKGLKHDECIKCFYSY